MCTSSWPLWAALRRIRSAGRRLAASADLAAVTDSRRRTFGSQQVVAITTAGTLAVAAALCLAGDRVHRPVDAAILAFIACLIESGRAQVTRLAAISLSSVLLGVAAALCGPLGAGLVGAVGSGLAIMRMRTDVRVFNLCLNAFLGMTGGIAYRFAGGWTQGPEPSGAQLVTQVTVPLLVATSVMLVVNVLLLGWIICVSSPQSFSRAVRDMLNSSAALYLAGGFICVLMVILWVGASLGPVTVLVLGAPLLLGQVAYNQRRLEEVARNDTLTTLVAAVETSNPAVHGRALAVAFLCNSICAEVGLSDRATAQVSRAARLHNLGLVRPESRRGSTADPDAIRQHPMRSVEMLSGLDFVRDSLPAIAAHHERWDGRGYPLGLSGPSIPVGARIIAVADGFIALLAQGEASTIVERAPTALQAVREFSGTAYDPALVRALEQIVEHSDLVMKLSSIDLPAGPVHDHDVPTASVALLEGSS